MNKIIKILICTHKEEVMIDNKYFLPIQVGAALSDINLPYTHDNNGDNISYKNKNYCELTAHYWAWKNLECEIIGLNHYRRFFDFKRRFKYFSPDRSFIHKSNFKENTYNFPNLENLLTKYDIILPSKRSYPYNLFTQYSIFHINNDFRILREVITEKYPDYISAFDEFFYHNNALSNYNMFITTKKHFNNYSHWLFSILFEVEKRVKLSGYEDQARLFGYLSERLINVYVQKNDLKVKYVPIIMPLNDNETFSNPSNLRYSLRKIKNNIIYKLFKL